MRAPILIKKKFNSSLMIILYLTNDDKFTLFSLDLSAFKLINCCETRSKLFEYFIHIIYDIMMYDVVY